MHTETGLDARLQQIRAIVVGASAGGVEAMMQLFSTLPADYPVPVICVLHMPDNHQSNLAAVFQQCTHIRVVDAEDKAVMVPGTLYFAPAGYHLLVEEDGSFALSCEPPVNYSRPAIDLLMLTAAQSFGHRLLGILLTGANFDGAMGMKSIKALGGLTIVQTPVEARSATMPKEAIRLQQPDLIQSLTEIKHTLLRLRGLHAA